jgi:hypothetical protein
MLVLDALFDHIEQISSHVEIKSKAGDECFQMVMCVSPFVVYKNGISPATSHKFIFQPSVARDCCYSIPQVSLCG